MLRGHSKLRGVSRQKRVCVVLENISAQKRSDDGRSIGRKIRERKNIKRHAGKEPSLMEGTKATDRLNAGEKGLQKIIAGHQAQRNGD